MGAINLATEWRQKPPRNTPIRTDGHWSTKALASCIPVNDFGAWSKSGTSAYTLDVVRKYICGAGYGLLYTKDGLSPSLSSGYYGVKCGKMWPGSWQVPKNKSAIFRFDYKTKDTSTDYFFRGTHFSLAKILNEDRLELRVAYYSGGYYTTVIDAGPNFGLGVHTVAIVVDNTIGNVRLYDNKVLLGEWATGIGTDPREFDFSFMDGPSEANQGANAEFQWGMVYGRLLNETEICSLTDNPWQVFQPKKTRIYYSLPNDCKVKTVTPVVIKHNWVSRPVSTPVRLRTDGHWSVKDLHVAFLFNNGAGGITKGLSPDGNDILLPVSNKMTAMGLEVDTFVEPLGFDCSWNTFANGYSLAFGIKRTKPYISVYARLFESISSGYSAAESFWLNGSGGWNTIGHVNRYSFGWSVNDASYKQRNIVCSTDIGSAFSFVNNQKYVGVVSGDPENNTLIAGTTKCIIGSFTSSRIPNCAYSHVYVYKRPLTEKESLSLNQNPWQLFTQKNRTIYTYNAKHNIVGTQGANTLKWNWGE